jgi:hypothetical protein
MALGVDGRDHEPGAVPNQARRVAKLIDDRGDLVGAVIGEGETAAERLQDGREASDVVAQRLIGKRREAAESVADRQQVAERVPESDQVAPAAF